MRSRTNRTGDASSQGPERAGKGRGRRACDYDLTAPHGWEFLLENLLESETEEWAREVRHTAILGEN